MTTTTMEEMPWWWWWWWWAHIWCLHRTRVRYIFFSMCVYCTYTYVSDVIMFCIHKTGRTYEPVYTHVPTYNVTSYICMCVCTPNEKYEFLIGFWVLIDSGDRFRYWLHQLDVFWMRAEDDATEQLALGHTHVYIIIYYMFFTYIHIHRERENIYLYTVGWTTKNIASIVGVILMWLYGGGDCGTCGKRKCFSFELCCGTQDANAQK